MSASLPFSRVRQRRASFLFLTVVTIGAVMMGKAYAGTDGGTWLREYGVQLAAFLSHFLSMKPADWLNAPDWQRIAALLILGVAWGLAWSATGAVLRKKLSAFSFALPFLLAALTVTLLSGSFGAAFTLAWLLIVAPALGLAALRWGDLPPRRPFSSEKEKPPTTSPPTRTEVRSVFAAFRRANPPPLITFTLGLALLGLLGRTLGLLHLAQAHTLIAAMAVLTCVLHRQVAATSRSMARSFQSPARLSPPGALLAGMMAAVLLAQWIAVIAPEVGPDALGGRVALPVIWMREGVISAHPEIILSYMGIGGESLYLLLLPIAGYSVAKIVAFACLLIALGAIIDPRWSALSPTRLLRPRVERRSRNNWAIAAAIAFAASTVVWWQMTAGFCDLLQAVLMLGAAEALRRWLLREDSRYAAAAGLLAGAAAAVKLNGVLAIAGAVAIPFLISLWRRRGWWAAWKAAFTAAIPAALMLAPALVRSFYLTGNPVFPFANGLFKSPQAPAQFVTIHYGFPLGPATWRTLYRIFLEPQLFVELGTYHPLILPLFTGCVVILFAAGRAARYWALAFLVSACFWLISEQNLRYSLFVGLFAAIAIARATAALRRGRVLDGAVPALLLAGALAAGTMLQLVRPVGRMGMGNDGAILPLRWALGRETTEVYLGWVDSMYPLAEALNRATGTRARVWQTPWLRDHLYFEGTVVSMPHGDLRILDPLVTILPGHSADLSPRKSPPPFGRTGSPI